MRPSTSPSRQALGGSRTIHWGDLSEEERERYTRFVADNKVQFFKDTDGSYAANVRLYNATQFPEGLTGSRKPAKSPRGGALRGGDSEVDRIISSVSGGPGAVFDYKVYPKFARLIGVVDRVEPKLRQTLWLMRLIEDLYEARYAKDIEALRRSSEPGEGEGGGEGDDLSTPFPDFVYAFFEKKFGLPALVQQQCWDMLRTVHELRKENTAVETFARFMDEYYDADDLLFFLYARSTLQKELGKDKMAEHPMHHHWTFRTHWGELSASSTPLNVTERQCSNVSRVIFGSEADQNYRAFMHLLEGGHLRGGGWGRGKRTPAEWRSPPSCTWH